MPRIVAALSLLSVGFPLLGAERVVLLTNGNVLRGEVRELAEVVEITTSSSHLRVPARDVVLVRPHLLDIYRAKAGKGGHTAKSRANLVRWCLRHNLPLAAREQFQILSQRHPNHAGNRLLRDQLARGPQSPRATVLPSKIPPHPDVALAQEQVKHLSKQTVGEFVRTVQPLLTNRCAAAGCHGRAGPSSFTLTAASSARVPQATTLRNLGATLRRVGNFPPEQTLLWMSARAPHGGTEKPVLNARDQQRVLAWIRRITSELAADGPKPHRAASGLAHRPSGLPEVDPFDPEVFNTAGTAPRSAASTTVLRERPAPPRKPTLPERHPIQRPGRTRQ